MSAAEVEPVEANPQAVSARISLNYPRATLSRVLERIEKASGGVNIKIAVEGEEEIDALGRMPVNVVLNDLSWRAALDFVAKKYDFIVNDEMIANSIILLERPYKIRMNVSEAPIENVIRLIAKDANVNVIIGPDVKGKVSFAIHDVPWRAALDSVLKANSFVAVEDEFGVLRITTTEKEREQHIVKVFQLRYVSAEKARYNAKLENDYVDWAAPSKEKGDFSLLSVFSQIIGEDGSVSFERRTNQVVVRSTSSKVEEIGRIIREVDMEPHQIKLKVRIVTLSTDDNSQVGVTWGQDGNLGSIRGGSWATVFPFSINHAGEEGGSKIFSSMGGWAPIASQTLGGPIPLEWGTPTKTTTKELQNNGYRSLVWGTQDGNYSGAFNSGLMDMTNFQAVLQMITTDSRFRLVQAPELVVMDNEEATVHIGRVRRYADYTKTITSTETTEKLTEGEKLRLGVHLLVVPHVIPDTDKISMTIIPSTQDLVDDNRWTVGTAFIDLPETRTKTVATKMIIGSDKTGVIAGLMSEDEAKISKKVPLLGDIPVVGKLFSHNNDRTLFENVMIFVTPTMITPSHAEDFEAKLAEVRDQASTFE